MNKHLETLANRQVYSVSALNNAARDLLENNFHQIWVEGEISNFSAPGSGHWYFSLKDEHAQIRCAMFRNRNKALKFRPKQGDKFIARGQISLYPARGDYQLIVENLSDAGAGAQQRAFEALKLKLDSLGWFAAEHKRSLPVAPKHIAVITSATGAVWQDIQTTAARRYPLLTLSLAPVRVQGEGAVADIVAAFKTIAAYQHNASLPLDAVILARGGGSLEDLQAFNDEAVATAIHQCQLPVVCGVGHETDVSIADFVADRRAATPTAAAELLTPNIDDYRHNLATVQARQHHAWQRNLRNAQQRLDNISQRLKHPRDKIQHQALQLRHIQQRLAQLGGHRPQQKRSAYDACTQRLRHASPAAKIAKQKQLLQQLTDNLQKSYKLYISGQKSQLARYAAQLHTASPLATLARGYSMVSTTDGTLISSANAVVTDQEINIRFSDGSASAVITS